jgi:hypothetical protein
MQSYLQHPAVAAAVQKNSSSMAFLCWQRLTIDSAGASIISNGGSPPHAAAATLPGTNAGTNAASGTGAVRHAQERSNTHSSCCTMMQQPAQHWFPSVARLQARRVTCTAAAAA